MIIKEENPEELAFSILYEKYRKGQKKFKEK